MSYPWHSFGGVLPICRGVVGVFYSLSRLGNHVDDIAAPRNLRIAWLIHWITLVLKVVSWSYNCSLRIVIILLLASFFTPVLAGGFSLEFGLSFFWVIKLNLIWLWSEWAWFFLWFPIHSVFFFGYLWTVPSTHLASLSFSCYIVFFSVLWQGHSTYLFCFLLFILCGPPEPQNQQDNKFFSSC